MDEIEGDNQDFGFVLEHVVIGVSSEVFDFFRTSIEQLNTIFGYAVEETVESIEHELACIFFGYQSGYLAVCVSDPNKFPFEFSLRAKHPGAIDHLLRKLGSNGIRAETYGNEETFNGKSIPKSAYLEVEKDYLQPFVFTEYSLDYSRQFGFGEEDYPGFSPGAFPDSQTDLSSIACSLSPDVFSNLESVFQAIGVPFVSNSGILRTSIDGAEIKGINGFSSDFVTIQFSAEDTESIRLNEIVDVPSGLSVKAEGNRIEITFSF